MLERWGVIRLAIKPPKSGNESAEKWIANRLETYYLSRFDLFFLEADVDSVLVFDVAH